jgi:hypothetical protein
MYGTVEVTVKNYNLIQQASDFCFVFLYLNNLLYLHAAQIIFSR